MKHLLLAGFLLSSSLAWAGTPDISIPESDIALIKTADCVDVTGTNEAGGPEEFTIHNSKAIAQFVQFLTSDRYTAVPKNLKPDFQSKSLYDIRLSSQGATILEFHIVAESILDLPNDANYYMQSERHSDNIMAPLLRLR
jgi:hypothetical protein